MSAAHYTVPLTSDQLGNPSRQKSIREEEDLTVGTVIITLWVQSDEESAAAAYHLSTRKSSRKNGALIWTNTVQKEQSFVAVLAPNCDAAMASLLPQPPGTFLLVKSEDAALSVFIKFRQAVRALTLVKAKDAKKHDDALKVTKSRKKELDTPLVYNLYLASETFCFVEYCWKYFLPQVQAIVFELCCEPHLYEDIKLEDWTSQLIPPSQYAVGLMPEACGFYIVTMSNNRADSSSVIAFRQVDFDFNKFVITIADGTHKPSAFLLATLFSSKRTHHPNITFGIIRDNFLMPDQVILKDTSVNPILSQQSSLQNCIDLSSTDQELDVLDEVEAACEIIRPHEPLLDSFAAKLHDMHRYFIDTTIRNGSNLSINSAKWSEPKIKIADRIIPILVELLIFTATTIETEGKNECKKKRTLVQFARAMRFNILFLILRGDDTVICRLVHQICQILSAQIRVPAELVNIIRDLAALFPIFLRLFLRNQGMSLLWKNLRHTEIDIDASPKLNVHINSKSRSFRAFGSLIKASNADQSQGERKTRWFGLARKPKSKGRKMLGLQANISTLATEANYLAFFRLRPTHVQAFLDTHLQENYFAIPDKLEDDKLIFYYKLFQQVGERVGKGLACEELSMCGRGLSLRMNMSELVLQLSLRFLYYKNSFTNWDRDVALMLRLKDLHRCVFDEIMSIGRRQRGATNSKSQLALACELRIAITCVSSLFRLERRRRLEMRSAIGDKKYLAFIYLFRIEIRELNESLLADVHNGDRIERAEVNNGDDCLNILLIVFTWIPKALLNEWMVICLKDLLETVTILSGVVNQKETLVSRQIQYIRYGSAICQVFAVVLRRMSDLDIQTLLVRKLGIYCPALILLLRFLLTPHPLELCGGQNDVCVQVHVLDFLEAFVNLDIALPEQMNWVSRHSKLRVERSNHEDEEVIEQLKGELLIELLGPRMAIIEGKQRDQTLWEFTLELMFPNTSNMVGTLRMLKMAILFRSLDSSSSISQENPQQMEKFLLILQALYTVRDVSSSIDYQDCVASHWRQIEYLCDNCLVKERQDELCSVNRLVDLNFRCLVVLASQRSQLFAIQGAFNHTCVLSSVLQRLQPRSEKSLEKSQFQYENSGSLYNNENSPSTLSLPPLTFHPQPSGRSDNLFDISGAQISNLVLPSASSQSINSQNEVASDLVLLEPGLHALAILLVLTYVIIDPNFELDEALCPRIYVSSQIDTESGKPNELLWKLQQHLANKMLDRRRTETLMVEIETMQTFVSTAHLAAIRSLLRLLCPDRFNSHLYSPQGGKREYIAKGAFSTVYRQRLAFPRPKSVAVKVVEHQRRIGGLCAISGLYNEVSILLKLQGNRAVTQLVDFGNSYEEQHFEIVMEYCPCSLTDWRASLKQQDSELSCRSCLIAILRVFEEACRCLTCIHEAGVCHFDIKSDNILVRSSAAELSHRLLQNDVGDTPSISLEDALCFADFGEAKVVDTDLMPTRRSAYTSFSSSKAIPNTVQKRAEKFVSLTRTRGTEAIKSPEVLKIKGSEKAVKLTLASDIWSMGCLLYELVTQELLFQNDDWAGLYAHLVVTQDQPILRSDHQQKIMAALNVTRPEEEEVVLKVLELCSNILVREPSRRPQLKTMTAQVRNLINDVHALPVTAADESFTNFYLQKTATSKSKSQDGVLDFQTFPIATSCRNQNEAGTDIVPVRLFWNFYLASKVTKSCPTSTMTSCVGSNPDSICQVVLAMDVFESTYEHNFVHFVYLSEYEPRQCCASKFPPYFIEEVHEEEHRTCFLHNSQHPSELHWFHQHAAQYFSIFQRCLRNEAGCVVFVALGKTKEETEALQNVLTNMLFFFLRNALNMSVFDILTCFSRDCAQFFEYPKPAFLEHLMAFSTTRFGDTGTSTIVQCRCGATVLSFQSSLLTQALATQVCTCSSNKEKCPCFHPVDGHVDGMCLMDTTFLRDVAEQHLVQPLETQRLAAQWMTFDTVSVTRESVFSNGKDGRRSQYDDVRYQAGEVAESDIQPAIDLVRGLQRSGQFSISSGTWKLYECELCRFPICALGEDKTKVAIPLP